MLIILMSVTIDGFRNKFMKLKEAFESKGLMATYLGDGGNATYLGDRGNATYLGDWNATYLGDGECYLMKLSWSFSILMHVVVLRLYH